VLEPDELSKRYAIAPDRRSNAGKAAAAEMAANGIEAVTESDMALALNMADAVRQHPYAAALLADGKAEQSFWWDDKATGQRCKCRPDWYQGTTIVDLKTCQDASAGSSLALALPSPTIPRPLITSTAPSRIALYS
jgi:hypothetical protein